MDRIDRNYSAPCIRSNAERRNEGETFLRLLTFPKLAGNPYQLQVPGNFGKVTIQRRVLNPIGITDSSHGIHPMDEKHQRAQVPLGTIRLQSIFANQILDRVKTNFVPSLTGFFSFITLHPRLKSRAPIGRPYWDFCLLTFTKLTGIPCQLRFSYRKSLRRKF